VAGSVQVVAPQSSTGLRIRLVGLAMVFLASAAGLDQIAIGMGDINEAAQQLASGAEHSQQAAQDLAELAGEFKAVVGHYRL
jgi:methyl-accepting chemotaxis protein